MLGEVNQLPLTNKYLNNLKKKLPIYPDKLDWRSKGAVNQIVD